VTDTVSLADRLSGCGELNESSVSDIMGEGALYTYDASDGDGDGGGVLMVGVVDMDSDDDVCVVSTLLEHRSRWESSLSLMSWCMPGVDDT
jgi:hypothetical protein